MASQESLVESISRLRLEDRNVNRIMTHHAKVIQDFLARKRSGAKLFEDKAAYFEFCAAQLAMSKSKYMVWNDSCDDYSNAGDYKDANTNMPPLAAFHYTKDEKEMHRTLHFNSIKNGDVLHLKVVDETADKLKLQILNKYGDDKRIIDSLLYADLIKDNPLVKQIVPPLKKSDLVRAVCFGNVKLEVGVYSNRLVTLNSKFVKDAELKNLKLGRVFKKDIPFYPEDIINYSSFGEYLAKHNTFENPKQILQRTAALKCDPSKTGPMYDVRCPKQIREPVDDELPCSFDYVSVCKRTREAEELLSGGQLQDAFVKIQEALAFFPDNSRALTVKGKIFLARSMIISTLHQKTATNLTEKAYSSFVDALKINCFNVEAANFHDSILKDAIRLNPMYEKDLRSRLMRPNHVDPSVEDFKIKFKKNEKFLQVARAAAAVPSGPVKPERMEI